MSEEKRKTEAAFLIDDKSFLHLQEIEEGYYFAFYDKASYEKQYDGDISREDLHCCPVKNPMAAARILAVEVAGFDGLRAERVSLRMLEPCVESGIRRRSLWEPETLPKRDIRFITPDYKEKFRIPDGGTIEVVYPDRSFTARCRFLDEYHLTVSGSIYHICEYAEKLKLAGGSCRPEAELDADKGCWKIGNDRYLAVQYCDDGWNYLLLNGQYCEMEKGKLEKPESSLIEAREEVLDSIGLGDKTRCRAVYDVILDRAAEIRERNSTEKRESAVEKLNSMKRTGAEYHSSGIKRRKESR